MIITVGGIKGGSGKSTVATNLTVELSLGGFNVLLIDADDQETSTDFTNLRNEHTGDQAGYTAIRLSGKAVRTEAMRLADNYDHIIIDTGGRDTTSQRAAITISDVLLVPFVPRSFDLWTLEPVEQIIEELSVVNDNLQTFAFLNRADSRGSDNQDSIELLSDSEVLQYIETPMGSRKAFSHAAASGLSVSEYRPRDKKAIDEFQALYQHCLNLSKALS